MNEYYDLEGLKPYFPELYDFVVSFDKSTTITGDSGYLYQTKSLAKQLGFTVYYLTENIIGVYR